MKFDTRLHLDHKTSLQRSLLLVVLMTMSLIGTVAQAQSTDEDELEQLSKIEYRQNDYVERLPNDAGLLSQLKFLGIEDVTPFFAPAIKKLHFAHILASPDLEKMIIVRYDFAPVEASLNGYIMKLPESRYLVHTKDRSGRHVALYFDGFKQVEINRVLVAVSQSRSVQQTAGWRLLDLVIGTAQAAEHRSEHKACSAPEAARASSAKRMNALVMAGVAGCANSFVEGLVSGIPGDFTTLANVFSGKIFGEIRTLFKLGKHIITTATSEISKAFAGMIERPDLVIQMTCEFIGGLAGDAAMTAITGGASVPLLLTNLTIKISKTAKRIHEIVMASSAMAKVDKARAFANTYLINSETKGGLRSKTRLTEGFKEFACVGRALAEEAPTSVRPRAHVRSVSSAR